jgi:DNA-binding transcriptional LysR family regulator
MDLRQVEFVLAIVDHGGFTKAAAALHVAQPSLSQSVRRLEEELGAPLFVRQGRTVRLSAAGEAFLGPARRLLRDASTTRDAVAGHSGLTAGRLDVVALPTLVADPLVRFIGAFRTLHPGVTVRVAEPGSARAVLDMLRDGRCEVGLTESIEPSDGLEQVRLGRQRLLAVLPPGPEGELPGRLALADLGRHALVMTPPGTSTRDRVEEALIAAGAHAVVGVETGQREAIVPLVMAGAGATVLPEPLALEAQQRGARVRPLHPAVTRSISLVHPADGLSPAAAAFVRLVADHAQQR